MLKIYCMCVMAVVAPLKLKTSLNRIDSFLYIIHIVGGGVQMGPLGTSATEWPNVPAPGDYDDGEFG
jgi:hypothetical protein